MGGGAWPFLVGGVICLVNSVNERDPSLLNSVALPCAGCKLLRGTAMCFKPEEVWGNNRSVMPLDVLGRTRATLNRSTCSPFPRGTGKPLNPIRGRDRGLQLFPVNQEFLVGASHKLVSITSLPFVHTARRYYRLNVLVRSSDCLVVGSL